MNKNQTAVKWLEQEFVKLEQTIGVHGKMYELIEQAKEMEQEILDDIDFDLTMIEDYAKGEVGEAITKLRKKIQTLKYGK